MKIAYPYMGPTPRPFKSLLEAFGNEVILPPRPSKRTLDLGVKYAPEFACLPFKIVLGTFIECLEQGADTLVTSGGVGPCRAGQYAPLQKRILQDLGYDFEMLIFEPPSRDLAGILRNIKKLSNGCSLWEVMHQINLLWKKITLLDDLEYASHQIRAREEKKGTTSKIFKEQIERVNHAETVRELKRLKKETLTAMHSIPQDLHKPVVKIGIVGEIYVVLEPASNLEIEESLGEMGAVIERSMFVTGWTKSNAILDIIRMAGEADVRKAAKPYLPEMVGGHGQDSVGHTVMYAKKGFDGVIQLAPFTCIPEIVAKSILTKVSKEYNIPVLTFFLDEQTGKAGMQTRLEAFVDLLLRKKEKKEVSTEWTATSAST
jgi:predicted nucleotide-binding protein (sugar kinase/HSP70/actin superfamily)